MFNMKNEYCKAAKITDIIPALIAMMHGVFVAAFFFVVSILRFIYLSL